MLHVYMCVLYVCILEFHAYIGSMLEFHACILYLYCIYCICQGYSISFNKGPDTKVKNVLHPVPPNL